MNKVELRGDRRSTLRPSRRVLQSALGRSASTLLRGGGPGSRTPRLPIAVREVLLDATMLAAAFAVSVVSPHLPGGTSVDLGWLLAFSIATLLLLAIGGAYRARFTLHLLDDLGAILGATAVAAMAVTFVRVLFTDSPSAASEAVRAWLFAATYLAAGRAGMELVLSRRRRRGEYAEPALIVGAGRVGQLVARRLSERPEFGLKPVAFLDDDPLEIEFEGSPPVLATGQREIADRGAFTDRLESLIKRFDIGYVIVTFSLSSHEKELALVRCCQDLGVSVSLVPRLFEGIPDQTKLERLGGLPLISIHPSDPRGWQFAVKYAFDRVFAAAAIVLVSPLLLCGAIGTLLTLGRPVFFRQHRVGMDGREFEMLKFRTMRGRGSEREDDDLEHAVAPGGVEGEDRRTRFGTLLRRTSIDELPQLLNVVRGQMSLIGPRPERVSYVQYFDQIVRRYADRHRVKSGITGWAQVNGLRGKTSLADRVEWDNYYVENWSLWLDLKIVLKTIPAILRDRSE
jgi:exopolysaccharide biosynthesis polyprenyl glycosylphosphotransferase